MRQEEFSYIYDQTQEHQFDPAFDQIARDLVSGIYDTNSHREHEDGSRIGTAQQLLDPSPQKQADVIRKPVCDKQAMQKDHKKYRKTFRKVQFRLPAAVDFFI